MTVQTQLPWPVRWAATAMAFAVCGAVMLWVFESGRDVAEPVGPKEVAQLRAEVQALRDERDRAQALANSAESLLKAEKAAQERLAQQLREAESSALAMKADLAFFEHLLPATGAGLSIRGLQAESKRPGQLRVQLLLMQSGKSPAEFRGRYELVLGGTLEGRPWTLVDPAKPLAVKQYARLEGIVDHPAQAVVKTVELRVSDNNGGLRVTQTVNL